MKSVTKTYDVYDYDELSGEAQNKVINDTVRFLLEVTEYDDLSPDMRRAVDKSEQMQTPWFVGEYVWDYAQDEVVMVAKSYKYLSTGEIFN
jgi:hypothetical protein